MQNRFRARLSAAVELADINVFAVVLAENEDGSGARLELQRALSFDEQDRAHRQDTYCLCTEAGATHYGGVDYWAITRGLLEIRLDADAASALGVEGFAIAIESQDILALEQGLRRVLGTP